jgi:hypothetical protein
MAPRRLLIVLVVLLAISTFAALLVPPPGNDGGEDETIGSTPTGTEGRRPQPRGVLVRASIDADRAKPRSVQLELGDQLSLEVRSRDPDQVVIAGFGLIDDVERDAPARFNLFADRTGRFAVRLLDRRETVGRIVIRARRPHGDGG